MKKETAIGAGNGSQGGYVPHAPPSLSAMAEILKRAVVLGRVIWGERFKRRCKTRDYGIGFNSVDLTRTLKTGSIISQPRYEADWHAYRFELAASVEGYRFVVELMLHCDHDYKDSPLISVRTAYFQRGQIGKSRKDKDKHEGEENGGTEEDAD